MKKHKPEIFDAGSSERPKKWQYKNELDSCGNLETSAVDSETGKMIARLFWIDTDGTMKFCHSIEDCLTQNGYCTQGLLFDKKGSIQRDKRGETK